MGKDDDLGDFSSTLVKLHDLFLKEQNHFRVWGLEVSDAFSTLFNLQSLAPEVLPSDFLSKTSVRRNKKLHLTADFSDEEEILVDVDVDEDDIKPIINRYRDEPSYLTIDDDDDVTKSTEKLVCTFENCGRELSSRKSLRRHIANVHVPKTPKSDEEKALEKSRRSRIQELEKEKRDLKCDLCPDLNFNHVKSFNRHVQEVHAAIKEHCHACNYKTSRKEKLRQHIKFYHDNIYDNKCEHCEYAAITKEKLQKHVKAVHLKVKDEACHLCPMRFSTRDKVKSHVKKRHTNADGSEAVFISNPGWDKRGRFICPECPQQLVSMKGLRRHIKRVHVERVERVGVKVGNPKLWKMNRPWTDPKDKEMDGPLEIID